MWPRRRQSLSMAPVSTYRRRFVDYWIKIEYWNLRYILLNKISASPLSRPCLTKAAGSFCQGATESALEICSKLWNKTVSDWKPYTSLSEIIGCPLKCEYSPFVSDCPDCPRGYQICQTIVAMCQTSRFAVYGQLGNWFASFCPNRVGLCTRVTWRYFVGNLRGTNQKMFFGKSANAMTVWFFFSGRTAAVRLRKLPTLRSRHSHWCQYK